MLPKIFRDALVRLTKEDILTFIDDNQEDLIQYFRCEIDKLDERTPEEQIYIDIKMGALGEEILKATLEAVKEFIKNY